MADTYLSITKAALRSAHRSRDGNALGGNCDADADAAAAAADADAVAPLKVVKIVANKGDVVYIPPYWFHLVSTAESSGDGAVALNIWSASSEHTIAEELASLPVPFEADWGTAALKVATVRYGNNQK